MKHTLFFSKTARLFVGTLAAGVGMQTANATLLDPAQAPLILTESVAPNLIFTLDDSGSMRWAYVPDNIYDTSAYRRAKSAAFNPMYYDPTQTYSIPVKFNNDGSRASTQYSTSFTSAYNNGFNTSSGTVNLSTSYRVTWNYDLVNTPSTSPGSGSFGSSDSSDTTNKYAKNPSADFGPSTTSESTVDGPAGSGSLSATKTSSISNGGITTVTKNGVTYKITRTGTSICTASLQTLNPVTTTATTTQTNTPSIGSTTTITTTTLTTYPSSATCSKSGTTYTVTAGTTYTSTIHTQVQTTQVDSTMAAVPAYYYVLDTTLAECVDGDNTDEGCYKRVFVSSTSGPSGTDERENFARWFSFYRNRALTTLSAANLAFTGLPPSIRLTWQTLTGCSTLNSSSCNANYLRKFTGNQVGNFYNWLPTISFSSSTYLPAAMKRAGEFLTTNTAWAYDPNPFTSTGATGSTVQTPEYACRASYQVMMTDGMWNKTTTMPSNFRHDGSNISSLPDAKGAYTQQRPFADSTAETLADLSFHYWATDLNTTIDNDVKPILIIPNPEDTNEEYWDPRNDPATWQHMTTFTVGLGLDNALDEPGLPWTGDTFGGAGYTALSTDTNWPPASSGSNNNVYDLWHTAINSRGEFFSANSPDTIVQAFSDIVSRISDQVTSAGAPGVTASVVEDTLTRQVYETEFNSEDWSGNLIKFQINEDGVRTRLWNAQGELGNKSPESRNIKMYSATGSNNLTDFTWANLDDAQKALLNRDYDLTTIPTDGKGEDRLNYLRGEDQYEEGSTFRIRSGKLGDIINSVPVIVGTPKYVAYLADLVDGTDKYSQFKEDNRAETKDGETNTPRRPMIYVGGNDGMLHGFDANTLSEEFAFVPTAVIENLYKYPAKSYSDTGHQFYVDGTPTVADVYYDNAWHTVLIGTLRAGGRSLFALDVTDPDDISLLWEKSSTDTDFGNLGYTFSQPVIARLHTGKWAVVIGNGYGNQASSLADQASLMVIDVKTGNLERELVVTGDATKANGLSTPKLADNNSDGIADYAYAGDLQGNLWRFDLISTSANPPSPDPFRKDLVGTLLPSSFSISYNGTPLYVAIDDRVSGATRQPITAPPSLVRHPSGLGYMVIFGTGKYFETNDGTVDTTRSQTLYGIWDQKTKRQTTTSRTSPTRSDLQQQTITEAITDDTLLETFDTTAVDGVRVVSQNPVEWYDNDGNINKEGWYLELKVDGTSNSGEMLINPMAARGQVILLNTLTPNADPCEEGVASWLYGLDPATGGRTNFAVFDLNSDEEINYADTVKISSSDTVVSVYKKTGSGGFTTNNGDIFTAPSQGSGMKYSAGPNSSGRQSWRILPEEMQ